jgi:hypothetical protein
MRHAKRMRAESVDVALAHFRVFFFWNTDHVYLKKIWLNSDLIFSMDHFDIHV